MEVAKQFYELGCRRTAEKYDEIEYNRQRAEEAELSDDLEKEIKRWIHAQRNNGRKLFGWIDMVELAARHFAEWGAKSIKSMIQERYDENCRCAEKIKSFGIRACEDNDILSLIENRYE